MHVLPEIVDLGSAMNEAPNSCRRKSNQLPEEWTSRAKCPATTEQNLRPQTVMGNGTKTEHLQSERIMRDLKGPEVSVSRQAEKASESQGTLERPMNTTVRCGRRDTPTTSARGADDSGVLMEVRSVSLDKPMTFGVGSL